MSRQYNLDYLASNIVMEMILYPKRKQIIAYKPLADKVIAMLEELFGKKELFHTHVWWLVLQELSQASRDDR